MIVEHSIRVLPPPSLGRPKYFVKILIELHVSSRKREKEKKKSYIRCAYALGQYYADQLPCVWLKARLALLWKCYQEWCGFGSLSESKAPLVAKKIFGRREVLKTGRQSRIATNKEGS